MLERRPLCITSSSACATRKGWRRFEGLRNLTASDDLDDVELDGDDADVGAQGTTLEGCAIDADGRA